MPKDGCRSLLSMADQVSRQKMHNSGDTKTGHFVGACVADGLTACWPAGGSGAVEQTHRPGHPRSEGAPPVLLVRAHCLTAAAGPVGSLPRFMRGRGVAGMDFKLH